MKIWLSWNELEIWTEDYDAFAKFLNFIIPWYVDKVWIKQDNMKFKRWENTLNLLVSAKKITDLTQKELLEPPLKISVPLIESASLEDEEELQEKWAILLANSLTCEKNIKPIYIEILKQLSSIEVKILDKLYSDYMTLLNRNKIKIEEKNSLMHSNKLTEEENNKLKIELYNLEHIEFDALNVNLLKDLDNLWEMLDKFNMYKIIQNWYIWNIITWNERTISNNKYRFELTDLWIAFIRACKLNNI